MSFWRKILGLDENTKIPERIRITQSNIDDWAKFQKLYDNQKLKFDSEGRLRYLHGAPVGDLVLSKIDKSGKPIYKESAVEWFDPESEKAKSFIWP